MTPEKKDGRGQSPNSRADLRPGGLAEGAACPASCEVRGIGEGVGGGLTAIFYCGPSAVEQDEGIDKGLELIRKILERRDGTSAGIAGATSLDGAGGGREKSTEGIGVHRQVIRSTHTCHSSPQDRASSLALFIPKRASTWMSARSPLQ